MAKAVICAETGSYCFGGLSIPKAFGSARTGYDYEKDILTAALRPEKRWNADERKKILDALDIIVDYIRAKDLL